MKISNDIPNLSFRLFSFCHPRLDRGSRVFLFCPFIRVVQPGTKKLLDSRLKMSGMTDWREASHSHVVACREQACMRDSRRDTIICV